MHVHGLMQEQVVVALWCQLMNGAQYMRVKYVSLLEVPCLALGLSVVVVHPDLFLDSLNANPEHVCV